LLLAENKTTSCEKTFQGVKKTFRKLSNAKIKSIYEKGYYYYEQKKYEKAFKFFKQATNLGSTEAQMLLGKMYYKGQGVAVDYNKAFMYSKRAAMKGNDFAQFLTGKIYASKIYQPAQVNLSLAHVFVKVSIKNLLSLDQVKYKDEIQKRQNFLNNLEKRMTDSDLSDAQKRYHGLIEKIEDMPYAPFF